MDDTRVGQDNDNWKSKVLSFCYVLAVKPGHSDDGRFNYFWYAYLQTRYLAKVAHIIS